jgi:cytochrome c553
MRKVGWILLASAAMAQAPTFQPIGNMSELMVSIIYPASDAIFYVDRNPPTKDLDWNNLSNQALMLAESGNLLLMPSRIRAKGNWIADSKMMIDAGAAAYKAAKAHNLDGVRAVNDALYASCVTCHAEYRDNYLKPKRP